MRDLRALPKAHLHLHLELGMRPATLRDLCAKYDRPIPEIRGFGSFAVFNDMCIAATELLREPDDWARLADEICADHVAAGCVYIEPSFWAGNHRSKFASDAAAWEALIETFDDAAARHGLAIGYMAPVDRVVDTPDDAVALANLAVSLRERGVVALGLHNDEVGHPPGDFVDAFGIARAGGLLSTPHAGELEGGGFVRDSVDLLGADRIQHGIRAGEVAGLVERLAEGQICLDVCPTSNLMLGVVADLADHPLPGLLDAGVPCSLNADDPLLFGVGVLDEYELARTSLDLSDPQLAAIARASIDHSGASDDVKTGARAGIDAWLASPS
ncbi:MAG: adenosine deaminase [Desertimonas sp.]